MTYLTLDTTQTQCGECTLYFPRHELDAYVEEKNCWARDIPGYTGPLWCIFCEYDDDDPEYTSHTSHATPGVKSPNQENKTSISVTSPKGEIIRAFKRTICKEMGLSSSSLIAHQTLPIAWDVAKALGYAPYEFVRAIGYQDSLLQEKGYPYK